MKTRKVNCKILRTKLTWCEEKRELVLSPSIETIAFTEIDIVLMQTSMIDWLRQSLNGRLEEHLPL